MRAPTSVLKKLEALRELETVAGKAKPPFQIKRFLSEAGKGRTITAFSLNQVVFSQGDPANAIFYIQEGKIKITVISDTGKEAVIAVLSAGDFFGEGCLKSQLVRMSTAIALADCSILRLEKAVAVSMLEKESAFSEKMVSYLLARNVRIEEDLVDQLFNSSEKRLARTLLLLANFGKEGKPETVLAKISQETLAEMVGTTRSRVSFFMNKFRKLGFVKYNGTLTVHSSLLNIVLHD